MRVLVVGQGVMGRAVSWALARRGVEVVGFDSRDFLHREGSSHGESRIIRTAYFEHPDYVPLARKSFRLWRVLEEEAGLPGGLLEDAPCLTLGKPGSEVVGGVLKAASEHGLEIEHLDTGELSQRFAWLRCDSGWTGALEREAGILNADACRKALAGRAISRGAHLEFGRPVLAWGGEKGKAWVKTQDSKIEGDRLVLCPGPWARELLGKPAGKLRVMRQVTGWTRLYAELAKGFPVFFFDTPEGYYYGMRGEDLLGVKIARHYCAPELESVEEVVSEPNGQDGEVLEKFARKYAPGILGSHTGPGIARMEVCRYTLTPDRHFMVGEMPGYGGLVQVAAGMSGHGFKFAPAIGELVADALMEGKSPPAMFSPDRIC